MEDVSKAIQGCDAVISTLAGIAESEIITLKSWNLRILWKRQFGIQYNVCKKPALKKLLSFHPLV